jgi:hypothetical protein
MGLWKKFIFGLMFYFWNLFKGVLGLKINLLRFLRCLLGNF